MRKPILKPEIRGTRAGYVIRFTCPSCATENIIISSMPKDHFRDSHDGTCKHCRLRSNVLTPSTSHRTGPCPVPAHAREVFTK